MVDMLLTTREEEILLAVIASYIESGEPVGSTTIYKHFRLGIKPARIRSILNKLEDNGWLRQIHTSGGRVPTDKAYEHFVRCELENIVTVKPNTFITRTVKSLLIGNQEQFVEDLSEHINLLTFAYNISDNNFTVAGLSELVADFEEAEASFFKELVINFEELPDQVRTLAPKLNVDNNGPNVLIGTKNPFMLNEELSSIFDYISLDNGVALIGIVGPKRMNYKNSLEVFISLKTLLN